MATPQVSGAAALAEAVFPNASGVGLKALLLRDVDPIGVLNTASRTGGRLNVDHAARCAGTPQAWIDSPANGTEVSAGQPLEIRVLGALCGSPGGVSVSATLNGSPFPLDARGDGLYSRRTSRKPARSTSRSRRPPASDVQSVTAMANQTYQIVPAAVGHDHDALAGRERLAHLRRPGRPAHRAAHERRDDRPLAVLLDLRLDLQAGRHRARLADARRDERRLRRHALAARDRPYRILVDPQQTATGSMTLTLYDVPPDVTTTITPAGPPVT